MKNAPTVDAKPFDINNYSTLPKGVGITQIKNRKEGLDSFLKGKDVNIEKLKE